MEICFENLETKHNVGDDLCIAILFGSSIMWGFVVHHDNALV